MKLTDCKGTVYFMEWSHGLEIGVVDWSHGVEYWSGFLEWNYGVKCWSLRETFILVVKLVLFERTP